MTLHCNNAFIFIYQKPQLELEPVKQQPQVNTLISSIAQSRTCKVLNLYMKQISKMRFRVTLSSIIQGFAFELGFISVLFKCNVIQFFSKIGILVLAPTRRKVCIDWCLQTERFLFKVTVV